MAKVIEPPPDAEELLLAKLTHIAQQLAQIAEALRRIADALERQGGL